MGYGGGYKKRSQQLTNIAWWIDSTLALWRHSTNGGQQGQWLLRYTLPCSACKHGSGGILLADGQALLAAHW